MKSMPVWLLACLLILPTLVACGGFPATPGNAPDSATESADLDELATVRLGYVPVMIYAPLFVAMERGYFVDEGLDVQLTPLQGGSDSVVQLAAGNFDAAVGGAGAGLFNAADRGVEFTIVAPMHSERPPLSSPLVISADRTDEIENIADLEGMRVAINATGAATEYWLAQALEQGGLTFDDIELVTLSFRDVPAALDNGSLDASILGEPLTTINEDRGLVAVLAEDFINGFTPTYLYMGRPLLEERPDIARAFLRAYIRACRDLQGDYMNEEIATIIEQYTEVPADITLRSTPAQFDPDGDIPMDDLETLQSYFMERGQLEYSEPLDIGAFVDQSLAEDVARELDAETE